MTFKSIFCRRTWLPPVQIPHGSHGHEAASTFYFILGLEPINFNNKSSGWSIFFHKYNTSNNLCHKQTFKKTSPTLVCVCVWIISMSQKCSHTCKHSTPRLGKIFCGFIYRCHSHKFFTVFPERIEPTTCRAQLVEKEITWTTSTFVQSNVMKKNLKLVYS